MNMLKLALAFVLFALPLRAEIAIQDVVSPGGIHAWLVQEPGIPFTALEIRFRGGTALDAPGKRGAVNLMTALIEEGTGEMDSQAFAAARDALAAEMSFRAGPEQVSVSARFLTENRDAAVDLLRQALVSPRFDQPSLDRVRGQVLSNIRADAKDPGAMAGRIFNAAAFGAHPYGSSGDGTEDSVTALTRDDILAAHKGALARDRIYVAAVGDIDAAQLGALLDHLLGDLPTTGAPLPTRADYALAGGVTVQDFPVPQSVVLFGHQGIKRDDPDFFAAFIANEILGGDRFSSRLMSELREKRGLTYGVGTYLAPMDQAELVLGQFSSDNSTVAQAIDLVRQQWADVAANGVTEAELADAKTYLTGAYPLRFDGNGPIANILVGMQMQGLPIDYSATRNDKINAVTLAEVKRVVAGLFKPEALHFVVVGQPVGVATGN
ncbi:M16 family metallopeptidase [Rhodobacter ferrooxidans]|uniref:Peptidase M16 domain protein n=1 Tax=Rhodobacter ferrooxidans TaxID=371731 RepID=C8RXG8_9RHOB|nr:pitrilysin family protein [Rhodobacter sp. SW2]EEW26693.1 peptidase M16 domain protein [Rhodobacter sp. SW2]